MNNAEDYLGHDVISVDTGIGKVVSVEEMGGAATKFLVIEFLKDRSKAYFNFEGKRTFRLLSNKSEFENLLEKLDLTTAEKSFKSKEERINYFKGEAKAEKVESLINMLILMMSLEDLSSAETSILKRVQDTLSLELSIIGNLAQTDAEELILSKIKGKLSVD